MIKKILAGLALALSLMHLPAAAQVTSRVSATGIPLKLSDFNSTTSAELRGVISDETGTGALVFGTSPTLVTPNLGNATAGDITLNGNPNGAFLAAHDGSSYITMQYQANLHQFRTGGGLTTTMYVTSEGISVTRLILQSSSEIACTSDYRGHMVLVAGGVGVKDTVRICAKDAANAYAYRTLY